MYREIKRLLQLVSKASNGGNLEGVLRMKFMSVFKRAFINEHGLSDISQIPLRIYGLRWTVTT